jgi:hypothetical protein
MTQPRRVQKDKLRALMGDLKRLQKRLQVIHEKTDYEDLGHGILALQIAQHTMEETLEHTGLGGEIRHKPNLSAHRKAKQWHKIVKGLRAQGSGDCRGFTRRSSGAL